MNVREDKMTNYRELQIRKPSLTCCVPELFRVSRRVKQENISLDVVKWVAQLNNYKHHNRNSKREFPLLISSEYIHPIFSRICLWCYCLNALH